MTQAIYEVYQPIRAYNGQLQLEFTCSREGLDYIVQKGIVKEYQCGYENYKNTGDTFKDLRDMGFVVKEVEKGYVRF